VTDDLTNAPSNLPMPSGNTPGLGQATPPVGMTRPVPGWVSTVSIMLGILGLLCWGWQGVGTLLSDMADMEAAGLTLSDGHQSLALVGYAVNIALAILLLVGGLKATAGNQLGAAVILRGWSWLKFLSIAGGLVIAWVFFDDLVAMNRIEMDRALAQTADAATDADGSGTRDAFSDEVLVRMSIGFVVVQAAVLAAWPFVVLAVVPSASSLMPMTGSDKSTLPDRES